MAAQFWTAPRIWDGDTCVIIGGGPSLAAVTVDALSRFRCIAVNAAFRIAPFAEAMFFGDYGWFTQYSKGLELFGGLKITNTDQALGRRAEVLDIKVMRRHNLSCGICPVRDTLTWNNNSGATAINLAVHFGAKKIILVGFDMKRDGDRFNYHNEYARPDNVKTYNPYSRHMPAFPKIKADLDKLGVTCVNATAGSALEVFPRISLEEII